MIHRFFVFNKHIDNTLKVFDMILIFEKFEKYNLKILQTILSQEKMVTLNWKILTQKLMVWDSLTTITSDCYFLCIHLLRKKRWNGWEIWTKFIKIENHMNTSWKQEGGVGAWCAVLKWKWLTMLKIQCLLLIFYNLISNKCCGIF